MGNCIKCKRKYCDCPSDGICDSCLQKEYSKALQSNKNGVVSNCKYNKQIIEHYVNILQCVINTNKLTPLGLSVGNANTYLSYARSALNVPYNYCQYANTLDIITPFIQKAIVLNLCT